ncbi:MAG TPA: bifunctional phosphopantothenoylcysteine decarboxylase/phosphopantothenate--cysteine ligase CoaBC [Flavisolibacter sp.]|nr:bifunctional phosphopantothenoylcysteine decarboxylase/phosphopantothenate--cysteine ligase CoaBC [Flavisolibacter sp.]
MLTGRKILIGITGSIAAYKVPLIVRQLIKLGAEVKVLMTPAAKDFVSTLTLSTLSKNPVLTDLFDEQSWANHVMLGRWADLFVIAPLSVNTLSKMANGQCDNLLLATYLSATCPVIVCPAMDEDMWLHQSTKKNIGKLKEVGCTIMNVAHGELASGLTGEGRMAEPEAIISFINQFFVNAEQLKGKKAIVTAGPTYEPIDPVRFIGNHSSGKMGIAVAEELSRRGAEVTLIKGPTPNGNLSHGSIKVIDVVTASEMYKACTDVDFDIAVMAAAVADYTPESVADKKIKKEESGLQIHFRKTADILASLGKNKKNGQILVGFALETNNEEENALKKLKDKKADLMVLNSLNDIGAGFKSDTNKITIFYKDGKKKEYELKSKSAVAHDIVDSIIELL